MVVHVCVMSQLDHPRMCNQVEWHLEFLKKIGLFSCRSWDFYYEQKIVNNFLLLSQIFKKVTFLHFPRLFTILRPLNFYRRTPWGLTFPKTTKLSLWAVTARVGRASIVKIVTKTADNLRFSLKNGSVNGISPQKRVSWKAGACCRKMSPIMDLWE